MIIISYSKKTSRRSVKTRSERDGAVTLRGTFKFSLPSYEIEGLFLDTDLRPCSFKISDRTGKGEEGGRGEVHDGALEDKAEAIKGVSPLSSNDFTHITDLTEVLLELQIFQRDF